MLVIKTHKQVFVVIEVSATLAGVEIPSVSE